MKISTEEREIKKIKAAKTNMTLVVLVTPKRDKLVLSSDLTLINRIFGLGESGSRVKTSNRCWTVAVT